MVAAKGLADEIADRALALPAISKIFSEH